MVEEKKGKKKILGDKTGEKESRGNRETRVLVTRRCHHTTGTTISGSFPDRMQIFFLTNIPCLIRLYRSSQPVYKLYNITAKLCNGFSD